jgi:hypothetical protein
MTQQDTLRERVAQAAVRPEPEDEFVFVPATTKQTKARLALAGPSGSGKTYTALQIATGLAAAAEGRAPRDAIAVIDTERDSARKYTKIFPHRTLQTPLTNFDPRRLVRALAAAADAGVEVAIIDSLSHFWTGSGGMLEQVDAAGRRSYGGNSFGGWREATPMERSMIDAMLAFPGHLIVTMRTRTEYTWDVDERGKKVPRKIGLQPIQRQGIEYEFDVVGDLDLSNTLAVTKSRCPELSGRVIPQPGLDVAQQLLAWLDDGDPVRSAVQLRDLAADPAMTKPQLRDLLRETKRNGLGGAAVHGDDGKVMSLADFIILRGHQAPETPLEAPAAEGTAAIVPPQSAPPAPEVSDEPKF